MVVKAIMNGKKTSEVVPEECVNDTVCLRCLDVHTARMQKGSKIGRSLLGFRHLTHDGMFIAF